LYSRRIPRPASSSATPAEIQHLGFSRQEDLAGKTVFDLYPRELAERYYADDMRALRGEAILNREEQSIDAEGRSRWSLTIKVPLRNAAGEIIGLVGMSRDITERKNAEELVRRTQKMEALGTLAGGMAHDFNNILLAISGNVRLGTADLPPDHPAQESLSEIGKASARATDLVRRILAFSRPQEPRLETLHLQPAMEEALKLLRPTLPATIGIECNFGEAVPSVSADGGQIHQIMMNLMTNAVHAIGDKVGRIDVALDSVHVDADTVQLSSDLRQGLYARLKVSDDGCGMDRRTADRIFDPFFTTKPAGQGTGLGFRWCTESCACMGVRSPSTASPAKARRSISTFRPRTRRCRRRRAGCTTLDRERGETVLYVDDEHALVLLAKRTLGKLGLQGGRSS
jgi:PAS domain S-box-containing protein